MFHREYKSLVSFQTSAVDKKFTLSLIALIFCSVTFGQNVVQFKEKSFWKGEISMIPHALYRGCGLASNGSFFLGDSGNLVKVNLPSGKKEVIVKTTNPEQYAWASAISPDLKQIAYSWFNGDFFDLMLVTNNAGNWKNHKPKLLGEGYRGLTATPYDWSPDGKWILASLIDTNWMAKIALISPKDGSVKVLKDVGKQLFNKISFSPDGKYIIYEYLIDGQNNLRIMDSNGNNDKTLLGDSSFAMSPYWSPDGKNIFYLKKVKDSFNLFSLPVSNGESAGNPVLVKRSIDFYSPLGFTKYGSFLYGISSPIQLDVYMAQIDPATQNINSSPKLLSSRYPGGNLDAILSPDGNRLAYKSARSNGDEFIVLRTLDMGDEKDFLKERGSLIQWFPDNTSLLVSRAGENGLNLLMRIHTENGKIDPLLELRSDYQNSIIKHYPILSSNGKLIYYIESNRASHSSRIFALDIATKQETAIANFNSPDVTSFSASPDGKYLGMIVLYQKQKGRPSALQVLNLFSGEKRELFKEPWGDATKFFGLGWSHDAKYIYYVRSDTATSKSLVWRVPSAGGKQQKTGLTMTDLRMPQLHPNGRQIFFFGGKGWYNKTYEIRAISISL